MRKAGLIFPHQLFERPQYRPLDTRIVLVEEHLFFRQYSFHKMKIAFHRASMKYYESFLRKKGYELQYIESAEKISDIRELVPALAKQGIEEVTYIDPADDWLETRLVRAADKARVKTDRLDSLQFLNTMDDLEPFFRKDKKKFFQTSFYKKQRQIRGILVDAEGRPVGGKWTYDTANRERYPKEKVPPRVQFPDGEAAYQEAFQYVAENYARNPGNLSEKTIYPGSHKAAKSWMKEFFSTRFAEFGPYEDAIVSNESFLHHSVLSPLLNSGLILPAEVVKSAVEYASDNDIDLNSLEGFLRQIIGWREFIRGVYVAKGRFQRTRNFWGFNRKIPESFYEATTGVDPVDATIRKVLKTGYCHHIERLMVLGNFMLLCEFDPDEVYRWFMELFVDAYDWVMVPNVYGMSQFADGGIMSTKPYISSSNYLMKMGDYPKGDWQTKWDGLFWRFMDEKREFFKGNPRMRMLLSTFDRMAPEKRSAHLNAAESYLGMLDENLRD